jgi:hypothetical protein
MHGMHSQISASAMEAYEFAIHITNEVMRRCSSLKWADISAMKDENPSIEQLARAVGFCAEVVDLASDKGLLINGGVADEVHECEWKLRQIERAISTNDEQMLRSLLNT